MALFSSPALANDKAALAAEGKALMMAFGGALRTELVAGMQAGGPVNAISVCSVQAPEISDKLSTQGWIVARSSHKLRNTSNEPDEFTAATIEDFLARSAAGEAVDALVRAEIVEENGQQLFRMVKAIPTGEACLACHGGNEVSAAVVEKLADLYPADMARGFALGDMRGVFTLTKVLE